jgi:hypothetical protein
MIRKRKRAKITAEGRAIIMTRALVYPRMPRAALAGQLEDELAKKGQDVPEREVLERMISRYRNHATDNPQEQPWNLATLDQYPIPPEALPSVIRVWVDLWNMSDSHLLTIREAKWVSRIYAVFKDKHISKLTVAASVLAVMEVTMKLTEVPNRQREELAALDLESFVIIHFYQAMLGGPVSEEYLKCVNDITCTWPEELKTTWLEKVRRIIREADNERPHNQAVQE